MADDLTLPSPNGGVNKGRWSLLARELSMIVLSILAAICLYPLLGILLLPLLLAREVAKLVATASDPQLGDILSGATANFGAHTPYSKPTVVHTPYFLFSEKIRRSTIISVLNERIFNDGCGGGGAGSRRSRLFPQLSQRIVRRWGYHFWQNYHADSFRAEDHVHYLNPQDPEQPVTAGEITALVQKLSALPFNPALSPWEMLLIPNFVEDEGEGGNHHHHPPSVKSALVWRVHHCLADGYSLVNIMHQMGVSTQWSDFRGRSKKVGTADDDKTRWGSSSGVWPSLRLLLTAPYYLLKFIFFSEDRNEWVTKATDDWKGTFVSKVTRPIPLQAVIQLRDHFKVRSLSSVLSAIVVGAVEAAMARGKVSPGRVINMIMPWPLPGERPTLGNHYSTAILPVSLVPAGGLIKRLEQIDREYNKLRSSVVPWVAHWFVRVLGVLPVALIPANEALVSSTIMFTNFPITSSKIDLFGYDVEFIGVGGTPALGYATATACIMYNGQITFTTGGDVCNLTSPEALDHLAEAFLQTFDSLQKLMHASASLQPS